MNLRDITNCQRAIKADMAMRAKSGSGTSRTYKRFTTAGLNWLKRNSTEYTAEELAEELDSSPNTIRHKCKALGLSIKKHARYTS